MMAAHTIGWQISLAAHIANVFGFKNRMPVVVSVVRTDLFHFKHLPGCMMMADGRLG